MKGALIHMQRRGDANRCNPLELGQVITREGEIKEKRRMRGVILKKNNHGLQNMNVDDDTEGNDTQL